MIADFLAQAVFLAFLLLALRHRGLIEDMSDGNVEPKFRAAEEAQWWLDQMETRK